MLEVRVCGGVEIEVDGRVLPEALIGGRQGRLVLAYLVCERERAVRREELADLLWPELLPDSWTASLSAVISRLRRCFAEAGLDGQSVIVSVPGAYQLQLPDGAAVDIELLEAAVATVEDLAASDVASALTAAAEAEAIAARGFLADDCAWVDARRDMVRDLRVRAAIAQSVAHVGGGSAARAIDAARRAVELDPAKEAAYRQLMGALAAAGERGEALRVWERCRITLVEELGIDPSPETEAVYLQLLETAPPAPVTTELPSGVVTFLLTDIVGSSAMWEEHPTAMAEALERHDAIVGQVVAAHGGTLLKSKLEGDATVSVFARATGAASAALAFLDAFAAEPWPDGAEPRLRMAMHTGEAFERGGDYFGPALNRAARLRSLAGPDEVLLSQAVTELVRDHLPADAALRDRGHRNLRGLSRGENVFQLVRTTAGETRPEARRDTPAITRPPVPAVLAGAGPFVGRKDELGELVTLWDQCVGGRSRAALIGGEPGVGKSRLAGEIAQHAFTAGALVLYGRCDEDLGAPLQPFIEAASVLAPALGAARLREIRGIDELTRVAPEIAELLPEAAPSVRADPDSERLALFDAVVQVLVVASLEAPVLLVLDDLHWAGKTTLSLLRHVLRGVKDHRLFVVGTYRDTELARTHPLAATLADLRRDADTFRMSLSGLAAADVEAYLAAIGNTDRALGREVAEVTAGNPFFLIEVVRHVEESGGVWQPGTLPEGVREATGRRLSRLSDAANDALAVAAVVGPTFDLALVEQVQGTELVDPITEACQAGLVVEEARTLGRFRFAHALVRQVLLSELVSLKRVRLHRTIAELLEAAPATGDADARLADLAYHWFECASTGSADRAVVACRRAADRALDRVAYEEAGDLYGMALQALEWIEAPDPETRAELHLARCDALLTAGDVAGARAAIDSLEDAAAGSERLTAWYTTYEGLLVVLSEPDRLTEIVRSIGAAAGAMRAVGDLTGEAKAHYVHASALERLGQIGAAERALDAALAAARSAGDRRLADSILAEAPPAALWGPSSVTRASGKCLDVVRVLRITSANPAVEAVALRCQALLEALRGRMDAARRMIRSARRTVESLGLTHRRLETEVAAGFIELLDGEAVAAEEYLRAAYDELCERGLGGEAAQAGAFLGRALLLQDRVDDADEVATEAEALAGSDLKAAIAWRGVRAEVAARRGDIDRALTLAREAVELATATDALLLMVDARFSLAAVLRAAGDHTAADAEAQRAADDCDAKGATVLAARVRPPAPTRVAGEELTARKRSAFENDATRTLARIHAAFNAHDWDALMANYAPDYLQADTRAVVGRELDADQSLAGLRVVFDGRGHFEDENIATRGRSLALTRTTLRIPDPEATGIVLIATEVDADGRFRRSTIFDADDVDGAIAALDEMYRAGEGAAHAEVLGLADSLIAALLRHDMEAIRPLLAPDCVVADDRRVGFPTHTVDDWLAGVGATLDLWGDGDIRVEHVADVGPDGGLWACVSTGAELATGGRYEVPWLMVLRVADGLISSHSLYDPDDVDAARRERNPASAVENLAWRADQRQLDACRSRDVEAMVTAVAPDFVYVDQRLQTRHEYDAAFAMYRTLFALDHFELEETLLASRGDLLALCRNRVVLVDGVAGPAEVETLTLAECAPDGRMKSITAFNPDDIEAAYAALDARHDELTASASENLAWRAKERLHDACMRRDWRAFRDAVTSDLAYIDHRLQLRHDGEEAFAVYRTLFALNQFDWKIELIATRGETLALCRNCVTLVDGEAGPAEVETITVEECDASGLLTSVTTFNADDVDAAYAALEARYSELTAPTHEDRFGNLAWRTAIRFRDVSNARDRDALLNLMAPGMEFDDRRWMTVDRSPRSLMKIFDFEDYRIERRLLATRGDLLALVDEHVMMRDGISGSAEIDCVTLVEIDAEGQILRHTAFAQEDLEAAFDVLDERFLEISGFDARAAREAFNTRDWERYASFLPEDGAMDDRRTVGYGQLSRDGFVSYEQAMLEMAPDIRLRVDHIVARTPTSVLTVGAVTGTHDGGPFEMPYVVLGQTTSDGRPTATVVYDLDDFEIAKAEYDRLTQAPVVDLYENAATRAAQRHAEISNAQDWDAWIAEISPSFSFHDRRLGLALDSFGDDAHSNVRISFELDELRLEHEVIATRGDSLALLQTHTTFRDGAAGPAEIVCLGIIESDEEGRLCAQLLFDADDLDGAYDELDARYAALGGNPMGATLRRAFAARDWDAFVSVLAPDCTFADYRTAGWGVVEDDTLIDFQRGVVELAPDARLWITHLRSEGDVHISTGCVRGSSAGGPWEIAYVSVGVTQADHRSTLIENYEIDDIARAQARFAELVERESTTPRGNLAARVAEIQATSVNTGDWDAYFATLAPDAVVDDRRSGIAVVTRGDEALASVHRTGFTLDRCHIDRELIETRGERLALFRTKVSFEDGAAGPSEVECFNTFETDEQGRMTLLIAYNLDDLDTAKAELDERFAAQAAGNDAWRAAARQTASINAHNWDEFVATFAPDSAADDRRSGIALALRGEEVFATHRVLFALDESHVDRALVATPDARLALTRTAIRFEDGAAGPAEVEFLELFEVDERGLVTRVAAFNLDDLDTALAELDARAIELSNGNLAWRVAQAHADHVNNGNWDALVASLTPDFEDDDRRTGVGLVTRGEQARQVYRTLFALDRCRQTRELVATSGDRLALVRSTVTFEDGDGGPAEVVSLNLFEVNEQGNVVRSVKFNVDDLAAARVELDARAASIAAE